MNGITLKQRLDNYQTRRLHTHQKSYYRFQHHVLTVRSISSFSVSTFYYEVGLERSSCNTFLEHIVYRINDKLNLSIVSSSTSERLALGSNVDPYITRSNVMTMGKKVWRIVGISGGKRLVKTGEVACNEWWKSIQYKKILIETLLCLREYHTS